MILKEIFIKTLIKKYKMEEVAADYIWNFTEDNVKQYKRNNLTKINDIVTSFPFEVYTKIESIVPVVMRMCCYSPVSLRSSIKSRLMSRKLFKAAGVEENKINEINSIMRNLNIFSEPVLYKSIDDTEYIKKQINDGLDILTLSFAVNDNKVKRMADLRNDYSMISNSAFKELVIKSYNSFLNKGRLFNDNNLFQLQDTVRRNVHKCIVVVKDLYH